jgi:hypothetical protein
MTMGTGNRREDLPVADPPSYPRSRDGTGAEPASETPSRRPRWTVIAIWAAVIALLLLMLILHLTGAVGPGTMG